MPIPNRKIQAVGRMQIGITDDCEGYWAIGHQPNGIGKMEIGEMHLYFLMEENERVSGYLDDLVNEALETWIRRL